MQGGRVLIVGAGIAGPTLAYWLLHHGWTPTLLERAPAPRIGGYVIDFWGVGYDVAERMGVLPALQEDSYQIQEVRLVDGTGQRVAWFDVDVFHSATHDRFFSLPRGDLARRLYEHVADRLETIFDDTVTALVQDPDGVEVTFAGGAHRRFELVIGADGLHSRVRALMLGAADPSPFYLGYYTAAFSVRDYPHRDEGVYLSQSVPGRQLARYALRDGRTAFFVLFAQAEPLALPLHDVAAQRAVLRARLAGGGWESDEILAALERADDLYFDIVAQVRLPTWSIGRVALVGDAACCPSLVAGQGSALAMAGAYVLAHALAAANDPAAGLAAYERRFKPFVDAKQRGAAGFASTFAPRSAMGLWLRNRFMSLLRLPVVGEYLVRRSLGDRFELPTDTVSGQH